MGRGKPPPPGLKMTGRFLHPQVRQCPHLQPAPSPHLLSVPPAPSSPGGPGDGVTQHAAVLARLLSVIPTWDVRRCQRGRVSLVIAKETFAAFTGSPADGLPHCFRSGVSWAELLGQHVRVWASSASSSPGGAPGLGPPLSTHSTRSQTPSVFSNLVYSILRSLQQRARFPATPPSSPTLAVVNHFNFSRSIQP